MRPKSESLTFSLGLGSALNLLSKIGDESVQCIVTSPPYWGLRNYGGGRVEIGREPTFQRYVTNLRSVFREAMRVLARDGILWLNLGDTYANDGKWGGQTGGRHAKGLHGQAVGRARRETGLKPKSLCGIPWRVALALQEDGYCLRSDVIWEKPNPMPESVRDRPSRSHEYLFMLTKSERYFYDAEAVAEPQAEGERTRRLREQASGLDRRYKLKRDSAVIGQAPQSANGVARSAAARFALAQKGTRNRRTVWRIATTPNPVAHFATFPRELARLCVLSGSRAGDLVLDMFNGSGTTGEMALVYGRHYYGIDIVPAYVQMTRDRLNAIAPMYITEKPFPA